MPNWCEYNVDFYGEPEALQSLLDNITVPDRDNHDWDAGKWDMTILYPCPKELSDLPAPQFDETVASAMTEKYGATDWYEWSVKNWSTKWPPAIWQCQLFDDHLAIQGQSAWSPPNNLAAKITTLFPVSAIVSYKEEGMCFSGADAFVNGECVYNGYFEFSSVPNSQNLEAKMEEAWEANDMDAWGDYWEDYHSDIDAFRDNHYHACLDALNVGTEPNKV